MDIYINCICERVVRGSEKFSQRWSNLWIACLILFFFTACFFCSLIYIGIFLVCFHFLLRAQILSFWLLTGFW